MLQRIKQGTDFYGKVFKEGERAGASVHKFRLACDQCRFDWKRAGLCSRRRVLRFPIEASVFEESCEIERLLALGCSVIYRLI